MLQRTPNVSPRKKYAWALEIRGFTAAEFTKCGSPEVEVEIAEFNCAGTLHPVKTASRLKYNVIEAEKMMPSKTSDKRAYLWLNTIANAETGLGGEPDSYKMDVDLVHFNRLGVLLDRWTLHGAFLCKLGGDDQEGGSKDDYLEKLGICYDRYSRR